MDAGVSENISTIRLYSAIHIGSCWKIQDRRQIKDTDNTEIKHNPEKANNAKHSKTKIPWFSRLLRHLRPGNEVGLSLLYNAPETTRGR